MRIDGEGVKTLPRARRLRLLDGPGGTKPRPETEPLPAEELADWMDNLPIAYLACRSMKHSMKLRNVTPLGRNGRSGQTHLYRCTSCRYEVTYVLNAAGFIVNKESPVYPKGYLAPKGAGRASAERNGQMRLRQGNRFLDAKKS